MGMYDDVEFNEEVCPDCGKDITFQSKSGECDLKTIAPNTVENFYGYCFDCGICIDYTTMEKPWFHKYNRVVYRDRKEISNDNVYIS